jgi:glycosyltransferase involved in cell wall biosynthesis
VAGRQTDVTTWYRAADVLVISSHCEGLSNVMIEALAAGLPVVSTRVSGSSILQEDPVAGLVVNTGDVGALAHAIACLLEDARLRARLGQNARRKFEARFSLESIADRTLALYQRLRTQSHERRSV